MTTTTATAPAPTPGTGHYNFGRVVLSEWTKFRSVRSTIWSVVVLVVLDLGLTSLFMVLTVANWSKESGADLAAIKADPATSILGGGLLLSQLAVAVLGVMVISSEYTTGMVRASLLAVPRRTPMLVAKALVFGAFMLALGIIISFVSFFIGSAILHSKVAVSIGDPGVLRAVIGGGLYLAMLGLFALALGGIIRHTAASITGVIGFILVLTPLSQLIPGSAGKYIHAYLPSHAGQLITQAHRASGDVLTPWQGYAVFAAWTVVLMVIAGVLLKRRDA
jgi:ABC-type transport system involved in multi-copper enzyme maturation permease subunit